jgi:phosphomannomutase
MGRRLILFDVDGTLTLPRKVIEDRVGHFIKSLRDIEDIDVGVVGGSDLKKQMEQLGSFYDGCWDWNFAENGLDAYRKGDLIARASIKDHLGEANLQKLINWTLRYLSDIELPCKRGTFIEYRSGMLNISPIGRCCSQEERDAFEIYDNEHKIRETMVAKISAEFGEQLGLTFSIGGQISFDAFPHGWDKRYCLQFVEKENYSEIHFFGDKTAPGGNDHEIFEDPRTFGHTVTDPDDMMKQCTTLFMS